MKKDTLERTIDVPKKENDKTQDQKAKETTVEFLASLATVLVTGLFIITFVLQAFEIPSSSMEDTLLIGDHVFVNREQFAPKTKWVGPIVPYRDIHRGDIVVFLSPDRDNFPAVPPADIYGVRNQDWQLTLPSHIEGGDIVIPPNSYFGMGDNRDVSYDSRFFGFIPKENVIGRPMFIYWSFTTPANQYQMRSAADRLGFLAHIVIQFFDETRWSRTFRIVK